MCVCVCVPRVCEVCVTCVYVMRVLKCVLCSVCLMAKYFCMTYDDRSRVEMLRNIRMLSVT